MGVEGVRVSVTECYMEVGCPGKRVEALHGGGVLVKSALLV